jgi:tetratricopeptide (TPR) repeat protein
MNYHHMFPVHLNNSRRLRRTATSTSVATKAARSENARQNAASQDLAKFDSQFNQGQPLEPYAFDRSPVYLNFADREMLLRQQAISYAQQGQVEEAISLFTLLIQHNPHSASNYNNRGLLHFQLGQYDQALNDYDQALQINPQIAKVYNNRANCYALLGELEAAIADYETAIDFDPTDIRARLNQGITFRELNLFEQAIESFDLALQFSQFLNSTDPVAGVPAALEGHVYAERGRTYHYLGDWNCAVADYHRALARLPIAEDFGTSHRLRGLVQNWLDELLNPAEA